MENTANIMNSWGNWKPLPVFPPELWTEVVNNLHIADVVPAWGRLSGNVFPDYTLLDKAVLGKLSLCNKSFRQFLEPKMWEIVILIPDKHGWTKCLNRAMKIIQNVDRPPWIKYFAFEGNKNQNSRTLPQVDWNKIEALFLRLTNLRGMHLTAIHITLHIATHVFQLRFLRFLELDSVACDVDCSDLLSESFRLTGLRIVGMTRNTRDSILIWTLARSSYLAELIVKNDDSWSGLQGVLLARKDEPFTRLKTLTLPHPPTAADLRLLLSFTAHFPAVTTLEFYAPTLPQPGEEAAKETVPIPDNVFPNLQSFSGPLYLAKGLTDKRPVHSLSVLCGSSSLTRKDISRLTAGSVPLTALHIYTPHFMDNCLQDIARIFPDLEDLSIVITRSHQPGVDLWLVSELEPLKKLRVLRARGSWKFADDQNMTLTKRLISTLQKNHPIISCIELNRGLEWNRAGAAWKITRIGIHI